MNYVLKENVNYVNFVSKFLILEGEGEVLVGDQWLPVQAQSIVYVPRWIKHQTKNTGKKDLKFFAITDYGLTGRFPINSEAIYRGKKENIECKMYETN